jgi:hypothetical protein
MAGVVAQVAERLPNPELVSGLEFKPQYCQKRKKKKTLTVENFSLIEHSVTIANKNFCLSISANTQELLPD